MKKVMFLLAVAGMFAFASCNNAATEAPVEEAPATEEVAVVEETAAVEADTAAVVEEVAATEEAAQ